MQIIDHVPEGGTFLWREFESIGPWCFCAGMSINADGSPHAYHPDDGMGLDYLDNAGKPGDWYGIVTDKDGVPVLQNLDDPAPGYYVSPTSLANFAYDESNPLRYVDSETIPFIALPPSHLHGAKLGDLAMVVNTRNGKHCGAIYADNGPNNHIGEGSIALAKALDIPSSPKKGGCDGGIVYVIFPGSDPGCHLGARAVMSAAVILFDTWGGFGRLAIIYPDLFPAPAQPNTEKK